MKNWFRLRATATVLVCLGCVAFAGAANSGSAASGAGQSDKRNNEIWQAIDGRLSQQQDIWFQEGDFPACISLLRVEAERYPKDYEVWTNLGWMEENIHEWDAALATYIRYREDNLKDPDAALPEATYFFMKKIFAKVPPLLEPKIGPKAHPNNFRLLASSYEKLKMYSDSIRVWKLFLQRDPTDGAAKHNLDRVQKKLAAGT